MLDRGQAGHGHGRAALRLLPGLARGLEHHDALPARSRTAPWLRPPVGDARRGRGPAAGRAGRAPRRAPRRARRPLARRLDHHRLRDLGLRRQAGRARPGGPRLHRRRQQPHADHRAAARAGALPGLQTGSPWLAFGGIAAPVRRPLPGDRLGRRADRPGRPVARAGLPAAAGRISSRPSRRRTWASSATRSTPRPRRPRWPPPRRTSAASPRPATRAAGTRRASSRRSSATRRCSPGRGSRARRHRLVPPAAPDDRRGRGGDGNRNPAQRVLGVRRDPRRRPAGRDAHLRVRGVARRGTRVLTAARTLARRSGIPLARWHWSTGTGPMPTTTRRARARTTRSSTRSCRGCGAWAGAPPGSRWHEPQTTKEEHARSGGEPGGRLPQDQGGLQDREGRRQDSQARRPRGSSRTRARRASSSACRGWPARVWPSPPRSRAPRRCAAAASRPRADARPH